MVMSKVVLPDCRKPIKATLCGFRLILVRSVMESRKNASAPAIEGTQDEGDSITCYNNCRGRRQCHHERKDQYYELCLWLHFQIAAFSLNSFCVL